MRHLILAVLVASSACSTDDHEDPAGPPEIEIMYRSRDGMAVACASDAQVPLTVPPQGGMVLLVGMRAKNLASNSNITLTASIRDTIDDQLLSVEQRPVQLTRGSGGWATPDDPSSLVNWANLPACPISSATRDLYDQPYVLRIAIEDEAGAMAEAKLSIVPTCESGPDGDLCRCQCDHRYVLGDPCPGS